MKKNFILKFIGINIFICISLFVIDALKTDPYPSMLTYVKEFYIYNFLLIIVIALFVILILDQFR